MIELWLNRFKRGIKRSPEELRRRISQEGRAMLDRCGVAPAWATDDGRFAKQFGCANIEELWQHLSDRPYPLFTGEVLAEELEMSCPGEGCRINNTAKNLHDGFVSFLGAGPEKLRFPFPWDTDFNAEKDWPDKFFRDIDILNPGRDSDVKIPWELSRLQWLIPVGQRYMINADDGDAALVRNILLDWIEQNPYGRGVNWTVAMEAAMRIFTWTWFFHVFKNSAAWDSYKFRSKFLKSLFEQAVFCQRYMEDYGVNGNHCTADAAALVFAGSFFGMGRNAARWEEEGWRILNRELPRQVHKDGVNFEGSTAYHRFVAELFLWPALYRRVAGNSVPQNYCDRLGLMANFTRRYTKPNGTAPLWGDNDDGRVLPLGGQAINDHSYLPDLIGRLTGDQKSAFSTAAGRAEIFWSFGKVNNEQERPSAESRSFDTAGVFVMAGQIDHVFIDCGAVGYGGRGGHGHNDCLSFEAVLNGVNLISDSGSYVYSASYEWRNRFRATSSHNTPMIDGIEQNRLPSAAELFSLREDAAPEPRHWHSTLEQDVFIGAHSGYQKLDIPVTPVRTIVLEKETHRLAVSDRFETNGQHDICVPFHFTAGCILTRTSDEEWQISKDGYEFGLIYSDAADWQIAVIDGWVSASYGIKEHRPVLTFTQSQGARPLLVGLYSKDQAPQIPSDWLKLITDQ